jgi:REP element-mobilizing transposase RayT
MNKQRNFYKNTYHRIYNQGAFKQNIFFEEADYEYYIRKLNQYKNKYSIEILCFCLMPNHYHLFTKQTTNEYSTSKFIADLSNSFTKGMNKKYNRSGVMFEGKTKSKPIVDEGYHKWIIKYILCNPVHANLVNNYFEYEYSSAKEIIETKINSVTSVKELFSYFGSIESFKEFILDDKQKVDYEF